MLVEQAVKQTALPVEALIALGSDARVEVSAGDIVAASKTNVLSCIVTRLGIL